MTLPASGAITSNQISSEIYNSPNVRINTQTDPFLAVFKDANGRIDSRALVGWTYRNELTITLSSTMAGVTVSPATLASLTKSFVGAHQTYRPGGTRVTIIVPAGVTIVGSSPTAPAMIVEGWHPGDYVNIRINGRVQGRGGSGGYYFPGRLGTAPYLEQPSGPGPGTARTYMDEWIQPTSGGIALECRCPVTGVEVLAGGVLAGGGAGGDGIEHLCGLVYGYSVSGSMYYTRGGGGGAGHGASYMRSDYMTLMRKSVYRYVLGYIHQRYFRTKTGVALGGGSPLSPYVAYATYRGPNSSTLDTPGSSPALPEKYFTKPTHTLNYEPFPDQGNWDAALISAAPWMHAREVSCGGSTGTRLSTITSGGALGSSNASSSALGGASISGRSNVTTLSISGAVYGPYLG